MKTIKKKTKMKKMIYSLVIASAIVLLTGNSLDAQNGKKINNAVTRQAGVGFTDANGDGICDNYDGVKPGKGKGPGNGQGLGCANGKGLGQGKGLRNGSGAGRNSGNGLRLRDGSGANCQTPAK